MLLLKERYLLSGHHGASLLRYWLSHPKSMYHLDESSSQQKEALRLRKRIGSGLDGSISGDQGRSESEKIDEPLE